jgi:hypothetical protein
LWLLQKMRLRENGEKQAQKQIKASVHLAAAAQW